MILREITAEQMVELWPGLDPTVVEFAKASAPLIVALCGAEPTSFIGLIPMEDFVYIWMETLPGTDKHKLATARHAKGLIRRALQRWPLIKGHCLEGSRSIRWMQSLGATFFPTNPPTFEIHR